MGNPPVQGKRNDIEIAKEALENNANMRDIIINAKSNQVIQFAQKHLTYFEKKRDWKPEIWWFYGPTGTGKSHKAHQMAGPDAHHQVKTIKWWDGYDAHENVIIDEIRGDFSTYSDILTLLDKYPFRIEVKGGYRQFLGKKIWITSNEHPSRIFKGCGENLDQLIRRVDHIVRMRRRWIPHAELIKQYWRNKTTQK